MNLYYDNNEAITQAKELISHQRSKYILRRFHLIYRVPTNDNVADPLTKSLPYTKFESHTRSMGIRYEFDWA